MRVKQGNGYEYVRVDDNHTKVEEGAISSEDFWKKRDVQAFEYYDGFWQMFAGNYAVDDVLTYGLRNGKVYFANIDYDEKAGFGLLVTDEVKNEKTGEVLIPAGIASLNSNARQMYRIGQSLQTAANIQGTLDAVTGIITVVTLPLTFGGSSALTASVGKIATQVATKEISKRAAAWAITKAVTVYVGQSLAKTYLSKGVLISLGAY